MIFQFGIYSQDKPLIYRIGKSVWYVGGRKLDQVELQ